MATHHPARCQGRHCAIHNPSGHHMRDWPTTVRYDKFALTERVCPHGVGHPDPDSMAWLERCWPGVVARGLSHDDGDGWKALGVHACCGCCRTPQERAA